MSRSLKALIWLAALAFGLILVGLSIYLVRIGLNRASLVSTVLSGFTGLIGLALAVLGIIGSRRTIQSVKKSKGTIIQIAEAHDVDIGKHDHA